MPSTLSPNMSLIVPGVGAEPGPTWANDLNADLGILDQHDHSAGQGVQITPDGININRDLSININNLIGVKTVRFVSQPGVPAVAPNLGVIYVSGNELVYNDEAGNVVPITNNGSVNSGAGSITGLPSGTASASYSSLNQTFVWQSATSTPANMDFGSAILRNIVANSKGLTLNPPSAMAADIIITLPTPPAAISFMTMDTAGNIGLTPTALGIINANIAEQTITQDKLALRPFGSTVGVGGYALSNDANFSTTNTSPVNVTNLSVTITTTGRPVMLGIIATPGFASLIQVSDNSTNSSGPIGTISFLNGVTTISEGQLRSTVVGPVPTTIIIATPSSSFSTIDTPIAGTYTYTVQANVVVGSTTLAVVHSSLFAYEI